MFLQYSKLTEFYCQRGDGQIDVRHFVIALSTVHRPSKSLETLRLAFKVSVLATESDIIIQVLYHHMTVYYLVVQIYEKEKAGEVQEEDLATILEIMLGVEEVNLSCLFLVIDKADKDTITYGKDPVSGCTDSFSISTESLD